MDAAWPIITNREALAVNDAWVGDAGGLLKQSPETVEFPNCAWGFDRYCNHSASMVWKKQIADGEMAVLLMNNRNVAADVSVSWQEDLLRDTLHCSAAGCRVRDIYQHQDLGTHAGGYVAQALAPHDSAFIVVSSTGTGTGTTV